MIKITYLLCKMVAHVSYIHIDVLKGECGMDLSKKEMMFKKTKIIIHSPLIEMTVEQRKDWFMKEWQNNNPILREIAKATIDCYKKRSN